METLDLIKSRRSTRKYNSKLPEKEKIEAVVEAGRYAPTGGNSQKDHFIVITNPQILNELKDLVKDCFAQMEFEEGMYRSLQNSITRSKNGEYDFIYNAPVLIVVANDENYPNNIADTACALENMMIEANDQNLGSCYINQLRWLNENERILEFLRKLGLKENEKPYGSLALGFADTVSGLPERIPLERHGNPVDWIE